MKLHQAFEVVRGDVVAFIGAGGKSSLLMNLGHELADLGWRILASTTTHISEDQLALMPTALAADADRDTISSAMTAHRFVFLYDRIEDGKVYGPMPAAISRLVDLLDSDVMLIEADQADGLPLKAPLADEPVIPPETSLVVPVAALTVLGQPLDEKHVYNTRSIIDRYGFVEGNDVRSPWVAQVLRDDQLGLQKVPEHARVVAFLNRTEQESYARARARLIARLALRNSRLSGVALGSARGSNPVYEIQRPVGAVVLAAGLSTRMGQPKVLLPWDNKTIIEHIVGRLITSRIDPIVVVTGHQAKEVKAQVQPLDVKVAYNRSYKSGEMLSSLKAGLYAMPDHVAAALVVLGDQPRIQPRVVYQITMAHAEGKGDIIVPSYQMRRGHPILISRRFWPEILNLPRGGSLRDFIEVHQDEIHHVNVNTDSILRDVDTPQDYADELQRAKL
jgi:molybdenum cofactor cytidylyltransferase